jgi:hypothetical protein
MRPSGRFNQSRLESRVTVVLRLHLSRQNSNQLVFPANLSLKNGLSGQIGRLKSILTDKRTYQRALFSLQTPFLSLFLPTFSVHVQVTSAA